MVPSFLWVLLWVLQAPASLPDLFWVLLTAALGLLLGAGGLVGRLGWQVLALRIEAAKAEGAARAAALEARIARIERWQEDHEP